MGPVNTIYGSSAPQVFETKTTSTSQSNGFEDTLKGLISEVDSSIKESEQKTQDFALGKSYDLHEVMIASEKANISFRFLMQVRNKVLEAYQEIMRMSF